MYALIQAQDPGSQPGQGWMPGPLQSLGGSAYTHPKESDPQQHHYLQTIGTSPSVQRKKYQEGVHG
jgi:hypothetical protein